MHEDLKKEIGYIRIVKIKDNENNLKIKPIVIEATHSNRCNGYHNCCNEINYLYINFVQIISKYF
jgi:hypothetical protein